MIEVKLIVGRYFDLRTPVPVISPHGAPAGFQRLTPIDLHITQSKFSATPLPANPLGPNNPIPGFNPTFKQKAEIRAERARMHASSQVHRQRVSKTGVGTTAKLHRNFRWLEWIAGVVSETETNGRDVLTGPMSGCWIMSYTHVALPYVGHVGTDTNAGTANSIAARGAWNGFGAAAPPGSITGFNPFNDWVGPIPAGLPGEAARKTFGLVTAANSFYSAIVYPNTNKPTRMRIAGIQLIASTLPANAQI